MKGQAFAGTDKKGHLIIFTRARSHVRAKRTKRRNEERRKKEKRTAFTSRQKIQELHTKKLVGLRKMICHHVHAIRQDDEYGAYG